MSFRFMVIHRHIKYCCSNKYSICNIQGKHLGVAFLHSEQGFSEKLVTTVSNGNIICKWKNILNVFKVDNFNADSEQ